MTESGTNGEKKRFVDLTAPLVMDLKTLVLLAPVIAFGLSIKYGQNEQARVFEAYKIQQQEQLTDVKRRLELQQFEIVAIKISLAEQGFRFKKGE